MQINKYISTLIKNVAYRGMKKCLKYNNDM